MVFKCKMCDASLNIKEGDRVAVCEYCGSTQVLPNFNDEKISNLYQRAEHYRKNNEFDKAQALYEEIIKENAKDPETYWSMVLCKYGVEYVEEEDSNKRIPTVNRTRYTSVLEDESFKAALQYADDEQRGVYEEEARKINEIQKGILEISAKEEPYDIFICYKETDELGKRTPDSVLAAELYELLSEEGYKVFYARVTLDDKFGVAYEPYIFAALQSAKVMLAVGTKPEHFEAAWVKNEWSRYLAFIKNGKEKFLIPAYRGMDPYDLPKEFAHLQAVNMGELGFQQDLIHGIRKLIPLKSKADSERQNVPDINVKGILDRGFLYLEEQDWMHADECMENVLNQDPKNAQAYLGKLLVSLKLTSKEELPQSSQLFEDDDNYDKILRFGDEELKSYVRSAMEQVKERCGEKIYQDAVKTLENAIDPKVILSCIPMFESLGDYKDAKARIEECKVRSKEAEEKQEEGRYLFYKGFVQSDEEEKVQRALEYFVAHKDYKDSVELADVCRKTLKNIETDRDKMVKLAREEAEFDERHRMESRTSVKVKLILALALYGTLGLAIFIYILLAFF